MRMKRVSVASNILNKDAIICRNNKIERRKRKLMNSWKVSNKEFGRKEDSSNVILSIEDIDNNANNSSKIIIESNESCNENESLGNTSMI